GARVFVSVLVGPLPDVAHHIHDTERTGAGWMRIDIIGSIESATVTGSGHGILLPCISPRVSAAICALRGVLPLPLMREALASPCCISARIFDRYPSDRLVCPSVRIGSVLP